MNIPKYIHTLAELKGIAIFTIGGFDSKDDIDKCEHYNITNN